MGKRLRFTSFYEDDADTFNYQKGHFNLRCFSCSADGKLEIMILKNDSLPIFGEVNQVRLMIK